MAYLNTLVAQKDQQLQRCDVHGAQAPYGRQVAQEELAAAELEVQRLLQPLAAAAVASLDQAGGEAALGHELDAAAQAGQRVLATIQRAREALEPSAPRELGGMSCSP